MGQHIRLDPDVAEKVEQAAKENSRTPPREVNHVLRVHYSEAEMIEARKKNAQSLPEETK